MSLAPIGALLGPAQTDTAARYSHLFDDLPGQATEHVGAVVTAAENGKCVEVPTVAIVQFRDGGIESGHVHRNEARASVLLGLFDRGTLAIARVERACKLLDPSPPSNAPVKPAEPPNAEGKVAVLVEAVGRVPAGSVGSLTREVVQLFRR